MQRNSSNKRFRDYTHADSQVERTYRLMQENQTLTFVHRQKRAYASAEGHTDSSGNKIRKPIMEVFTVLDTIIDESDPDTKLPQIYHAYQTGEALRTRCNPDDPTKLKDVPVKDFFSEQEWAALPAEYQSEFSKNLAELYPNIQDWSWLPLVGFIHDLGKVLASKEWGALPQWAVVGDTFVVGAPFAKANIYSKERFFAHNDDLKRRKKHPEKFGEYTRHCGFDEVEMSFGHDEYLPAVLRRTYHHLPDEALYMIRYHSFYPWHTPREGARGYTELANREDWLRLPLVKLLSSSDLYSKDDAAPPNINDLRAFYKNLVLKFIPGRPESEHELRPARLLW